MIIYSVFSYLKEEINDLMKKLIDAMESVIKSELILEHSESLREVSE